MTEKVLKSLTEGLVANFGPLMNAELVPVASGVPKSPPALVPVMVKSKLAPALSDVEALAKPELTLLCADDKDVTETSCDPAVAEVVAVTPKALLLLLLALTVLKLSLSFTAVRAVLNSDIMNMTADNPLTLFSFLVILALMALTCGARSASTKFCANDATSTPEPALSELMIFCALALLAAAS